MLNEICAGIRPAEMGLKVADEVYDFSAWLVLLRGLFAEVFNFILGSFPNGADPMVEWFFLFSGMIGMSGSQVEILGSSAGQRVRVDCECAIRGR